MDTLGLAPINLGEQHVAVTGELFGTHLVDDDATVDSRRDIERDAIRDVRLDEARHDVGAGALRGDDEVDTRRASELGDADNRSLDVLASHHHEIG